MHYLLRNHDQEDLPERFKRFDLSLAKEKSTISVTEHTPQPRPSLSPYFIPDPEKNVENMSVTSRTIFAENSTFKPMLFEEPASRGQCRRDDIANIWFDSGANVRGGDTNMEDATMRLEKTRVRNRRLCWLRRLEEDNVILNNHNQQQQQQQQDNQHQHHDHHHHYHYVFNHHHHQHHYHYRRQHRHYYYYYYYTDTKI
ncbi:hypothetical protein HZH68_009500 [Vespula germanica]|uniref:Uncharacterized protein n=1 Tax=Vespula germanica TaxID=30212 RepID=A0A834N4G1_VESGE|nr:hypothetical protein HZH68_009500 [Vespula germanica]